MSSRKSSRIASRGPQQQQEGPARVDLTEEDSPQREAERQHSEEVVTEAEPVRTLKPNVAYDLYKRLKDGKVSLKTIEEYLKERGFRSEYAFLIEMEKLKVVGEGTAQRTLENISSDPLENVPAETLDDDERLFSHFEPRFGVAANTVCPPGNLFRSREHERVYVRLLKRGVVNPRSVDFDFLDSLKLNLRGKFARLQLENFCTDITLAHSELTAYFYSNLSFVDANHLSFSFMDKDYIVDVDLLADIIGVERRSFQPIKVSTAYATLDIVRDRTVEGKISYTRMNATNVLLHKVVINCIRPKSTSKTDVSKTEAKLMFAINQGRPFSLPHVILFHMYRTVVKDKGQLPYSSIITKLFRHFDIQVPASLCLTKLNSMLVGERMVMKMKIPELTVALERLRKQTPSKKIPTASSKRKGKEPMAQKKRRKIILQDEEDEEDAMTLSTLSTRLRSPVILRTEAEERLRKEAEEKEAEKQRKEKEEKERRREEEKQRREEERKRKEEERKRREEEERRKEEERQREEERREAEKQREAEAEERRRKEEEERNMQEDMAAAFEPSSAGEETEKHPQTDIDVGDQFSTPPTGIHSGGVAGEQGTISPLHFSDVSRSGADPEEVYASHFPEHEESSPAEKERAEREAPSFQTYSADPSGSNANTTAFSQLLDVMLDLKKQVYGIDFEMRDLKKALLSTSVNMQDQINALRAQVESNQTGAELASVKEHLAKLDKSVQELSKFQLVRFPSGP